MTKVTATAKASTRNTEAANAFAANREARYERYKKQVTFGNGEMLPADDEIAIGLSKLCSEVVTENKDFIDVNGVALKAAGALETHMIALVGDKEREDYIFALVDLADKAENKFGNEKAGKIIELLHARIVKIPAAVQFKLDELVNIGKISGAISMLPTFMLTNSRIEARINDAFDKAEELVQERLDKEEKERKDKAEEAVINAKAAAVTAGQEQKVSSDLVNTVKELITRTTDLDAPESEAMIDAIGDLNLMRLPRINELSLQSSTAEILDVLTGIGINTQWLLKFVDSLPHNSFRLIFAEGVDHEAKMAIYVNSIKELLHTVTLEELVDFTKAYLIKFGATAGKLSEISEEELQWVKDHSEAVFKATVVSYQMMLDVALFKDQINQKRFDELTLMLNRVIGTEPETVTEEAPVEVKSEPAKVLVTNAAAASIITSAADWMLDLANTTDPRLDALVDVFGELNLLRVQRMSKLDFATMAPSAILGEFQKAGATDKWVAKVCSIMANTLPEMADGLSKDVSAQMLQDFMLALAELVKKNGMLYLIDMGIKFHKQHKDAVWVSANLKNPLEHLPLEKMRESFEWTLNNAIDALPACVLAMEVAVYAAVANNEVSEEDAVKYRAVIGEYGLKAAVVEQENAAKAAANKKAAGNTAGATNSKPNTGAANNRSSTSTKPNTGNKSPVKSELKRVKDKVTNTDTTATDANKSTSTDAPKTDGDSAAPKDADNTSK